MQYMHDFESSGLKLFFPGDAIGLDDACEKGLCRPTRQKGVSLGPGDTIGIRSAASPGRRLVWKVVRTTSCLIHRTFRRRPEGGNTRGNMTWPRPPGAAL